MYLFTIYGVHFEIFSSPIELYFKILYVIMNIMSALHLLYIVDKTTGENFEKRGIPMKKKLSSVLMIIALLSLVFGSTCFAAVTPASLVSSLDKEDAKDTYDVADYEELTLAIQEEMIRQLDNEILYCFYVHFPQNSKTFSLNLYTVEEDYVLGNEFATDWFLDNQHSGTQIVGFINNLYKKDFAKSFDEDAASALSWAIIPISSRVDLRDSIEDSIKKEKVPITYEFLSLGNDNWSMVIVNFNLYQISEGDTLSSIAKKFDMPVSQLAKNNGIEDSNQINVGNFLVIR